MSVRREQGEGAPRWWWREPICPRQKAKWSITLPIPATRRARRRVGLAHSSAHRPQASGWPQLEIFTAGALQWKLAVYRVQALKSEIADATPSSLHQLSAQTT